MLIFLLALRLAQPDPVQTPGAVRPLSQTVVCTTRWGLDQRHVGVRMKREVLARYHIAWADRILYVFDHLIPRQLAGADLVKNIWPQPKAESKLKDVLENRLHRAVCAGTLSLADAQAQMRTWTPGG